MGGQPVTKELLTERLSSAFDPVFLDIQDTSGGCGQSFNVTIVSAVFEGKPLLKRHRLVNDALQKEIALLHAFSQKPLTPAQWEAGKRESL